MVLMLVYFKTTKEYMFIKKGYLNLFDSRPRTNNKIQGDLMSPWIFALGPYRKNGVA